MSKRIGIYIYEGAEVLDFAGPFEVFSTAARLHSLGWEVLLIAQSREAVEARGGMRVVPHSTLVNCPRLDVLLVVGGVHRDEMQKPAVLEGIRRLASGSTQLASVCTGIFILASAALVERGPVTTHWEDIDDLRTQFPALQVVDTQRWVVSEEVVSSAGISAGIDMALELVSRWLGLPAAEHTARQMDYHWRH
ncbi:DJ-1/PfpI family protein [Gilvimarinus algae]|uniref:DJ-1/PfpI family protein n=1 Tax=Gilvimarinus algae TaxID=3058037 RepID=A0ABT8TJA0_9GAMM|nr:DJ-1/PfpI family protein [Gilvimarinus sp. SDUM040014]MDO3383438.1 DJ-1/PfpI family protein [Gilvimarinus sp. SDUM040014]